MIAFKGICGGGNNLYIDDIEINESSTTTINESRDDIVISPNPAKDILNIKGAYSTVNIFNAFGQLVLSSEYTNSINTSSLNNGIYLIKLSAENRTTIKRITINR